MLRIKTLVRFIATRRIHTALTILALFLAGCGEDQSQDLASTGSGQTVGRVDAADGSSGERSEAARGRILFFGDSITAGYGLDPEEAFPALIQEEIDDRDWPFESVNAGLSGETTAGGLRRIDWILRQEIDVFVLELGGNDGLRGISPMATRMNLTKIVEQVREKYPDASIVIAGMRIPPNLGRSFTEEFAAVFPEVAEETGATLIPFIGEDVIGKRRLIQMDGIHPTAAGHEVIAETVWDYLEPILEQRMLEMEGV